jgi:hypothetical protein
MTYDFHLNPAICEKALEMNYIQIIPGCSDGPAICREIGKKAVR